MILDALKLDINSVAKFVLGSVLLLSPGILFILDFKPLVFYSLDILHLVLYTVAIEAPFLLFFLMLALGSMKGDIEVNAFGPFLVAEIFTALSFYVGMTFAHIFNYFKFIGLTIHHTLWFVIGAAFIFCLYLFSKRTP